MFLVLDFPTMGTTTLAERLRLALNNKPGAKQKDLAEYCGVAQPSVTDWFNGETKNIIGIKLKLAAEFLGVNQVWLGTGKGEMYAPPEYTGDKKRDALIDIIKNAPEEYLGQLERNVHAVCEPKVKYGNDKNGNKKH